MRTVKNYINEKFVEDSDPIADMGIGTRHLISKWMKENNQEDTDDNALIQCAKHGKTEWVEYLLNRGADVRTDDDWALQWASYHGHAEVVKLLLNAGANVHVKDDWALRWASDNGHAEVVKLLLNAGANVHAGNDHALRWASNSGHVEVVKILLNAGANVHDENDGALRWASEKGHVEVVKILLNAGANVHAENDGALRLASSNGHDEVVKILKDHIKKNKIKESLFEKFVEDSDPIKDLGIGIFYPRTFESAQELGEFLYNNIEVISEHYGYEYDGKVVVNHKGYIFIPDNYRHAIGIYITQFVSDFPAEFNTQEYRNGYTFNIKYIWYMSYFIETAKNKKEVVYESVNEKFTEDSDPVKDMGIGTRCLISKWMKEKGEEDTDDNALAECAGHGKTEWVEYLLNAGADVHAVNDAALRWASYNGHAEVVKILLNAGADVHVGKDLALRGASYTGHAEVVKILLKAGADVHANDDYALRWASHSGYVEVVKIIKDHIKKNKIKESLNEKFTEDSDPIADMGIGVRHQIKKWMSEQGISETFYKIYPDNSVDIYCYFTLKENIPDYIKINKALSITIRDNVNTLKGLPETLKGFLSIYSENLKSLDYAPIFLSSTLFIHTDISKNEIKNYLRRVIKKKSNIIIDLGHKKIHSFDDKQVKDFLNESVNEKFTEDSDPIKDMGIGMRILISKWMKSLGEADTDNLALIECSRYGKTEWVKYLLNHGDDMHNAVVDTSLRQASYNGHTEIVKLLLKYKPDVNITDFQLRLASQKGHIEVVKILVDHINKNKESLLEKFTEDSDPITDMGIGLTHQIKKWLEEQGFFPKSYKILPNLEINLMNQSLYINGNLPEYIKFNEVEFSVWAKNITSAKGFPKKINSLLCIRDSKLDSFDGITTDLFVTLSLQNTQYPESELKKYIKRVIKEKGVFHIHINCDEYEITPTNYKKYLYKSLNEKFTEDSDPITDLGIGTRHQISKWMKEIGEEDTDNNALAECANHGKTEWVEYLLNRGADVHAWDDYALRYASQKGYAEVVKLLLNAGADVHAKDDLALQWASHNGHAEVVKILLKAGADVHADDDLALRWASRNGHAEVVKILLNAGADAHVGNDVALRWASDNGHFEVVKILQDHIKKNEIKEFLHEKFTEDSDPITDMGIGMEKIVDDFFKEISKDRSARSLEEQIVYAITHNKIDIVNYLFQKTKNINYKNGLFISVAAQYNYISIARILLEAGIHVPYMVFYETAARGFVDMLELFIEHGMDIHNENEKALKYAVINKKYYTTKFLLEQGADPMVSDNYCLKKAAERGSKEIVQLLLSYGADPTAGNNYAIEWADILGFSEISKILKKCGHINEKFTEDSDPINDLGIGTRHLISKWMKEKGEEDTDNNALAECARHGKTEWVEYLLNRGADVHARADWALQWASGNGHAEVVKLLLNAGANVHAKDDWALRWASGNRHVEVVKILKDHIKNKK